MDENFDTALAKLRLATEWTNSVSEEQVTCLKLWPVILINGLKRHTAEIDLESRTITYNLKFKLFKKLNDFTVLSIIESGIWALLGPTWRVSFIIKDKAAYIGTRQKDIEDTKTENSLGSVFEAPGRPNLG
jgi:hypothetical protein